ncbi:MAG: rRNA maturation RNase YbeY [Pirellulales bacterium]|nr:rRNA maturation RNase YbeY [Pirellulales bacterium]
MNDNRDWTIEVADEQTVLAVDEDRLRRAVELVLEASGIDRANVSVAVVDNPTIHQLNRRYLDHDHPTDVLSFVLARGEAELEGQIVVSAETARAEAARYGWPPENELLLYVVHGALHLTGQEDQTVESRARMREREKEILARFGLEPRWGAASDFPDVETEE